MCVLWKMIEFRLMKYIVGIDEVGRGPLAGPVTVCAVVCDETQYKKLKLSKLLPKSGKDSKKLKEQDRNKFQKELKSLKTENKINFSITHVSNKVIDSKGISYAIRFAIKKNLESLKVSKNSKILLDGSLKAPEEYKDQKTIIKGDEKEKIIAWASILAKVERDTLMIKMNKKYSGYDFHINKGYGTKKHLDAISSIGVSPIHRKTWIRG